MPSANDDITFKDGLDSTYKLRSKDISSAQDGSLQQMRHLATPYPVDYGVGGCYRNTSKNGGTMAAGLAAASSIYAFRNSSASLNAVVSRVRFGGWSLSVAFAAGLITLDMFVARSFSVMDTGGSATTLTGSEAKLRTAMATVSAAIQHSVTGTLTAGTRTLDTNVANSLALVAPTSTNTPFSSGQSTLFEVLSGEHPLVLAQNEGFVIRATVPGTGTWAFQVTTEWSEVPLVNF